MVEEEKKPEETEKAKEEEKKEESKQAENTEESKDGEAVAADPQPPPPPPQEIVLKVFMHCEGCARKVRRCLKAFPGVEEVVTDCKSHMVVVKGEKADPVKVLERVQSKSHRQVELLSPIPNPPEEIKPPEEEKPAAPEEEEKKEEPQIVMVVLKIHMHCEACAQEMKRRIERMKGVESAEPDLKNSEVSVKGVYDPAMLIEYVYKRCGKHAVIVKQETEEKKEEAKAEEEGEKEEKKEEKGEGEGEEVAKPEEEAVAVTEETKVEEMKINEYYYNYNAQGMMNDMELYAHHHAYPAYYQTPPPPQMFSDENPNACTVM